MNGATIKRLHSVYNFYLPEYRNIINKLDQYLKDTTEFKYQIETAEDVSPTAHIIYLFGKKVTVDFTISPNSAGNYEAKGRIDFYYEHITNDPMCTLLFDHNEMDFEDNSYDNEINKSYRMELKIINKLSKCVIERLENKTA
ncbi:hypothetical protein tloyanaT_26030 [Thalassotalea loyana]|uniref:DUF1249 domain-containing protein n=1 Tax=Thalassotalea loyana TaxID=280483 RepID=A0ABQ6HHS8_9GAMM|nr:hypothetical protein [Thalassotalea loyana]GLX86350.1 hypothetical protein tloyanaT_26030 [Thalassotalea loyana]